MRTPLGAALLVALGLLLGACGVGGQGSSARGDSPPVGTASAAPAKVLVVMEENHSYREMRDSMPYLTRLSDTYGYATNWTAITHPERAELSRDRWRLNVWRDRRRRTSSR